MRRTLLTTLLCTGLVSLTPATASIPVAGRVFVPGGTPLAEAEVLLLPLTDPLEQLRARADGLPESEPLRGLTDATGRFELAAPHAGMWKVRVEAKGFVPLEAVLRPLIDPTVLDDAHLDPDAGLNVKVTAPDGKPVAGASVAVTTDAGPYRFDRSTWEPADQRGITADDGTVRLPRAESGAVAVSAYAEGHPIRRLRGNRGTAAHVRLAEGLKRTLVVLAGDGRPVEGALVAVGDELHAVGRSDERGQLTVHLEKNVATEVSAALGDGRRTSTRLGPDLPDPEKKLPLTLPDRLSLVGRLIDAASRRGIGDGLVWDVRNPRHCVRSDRAGGFVISGPAGRRFELTAGAPGFLRADPFGFQLLDDGRPGPTLALSPAASIAGKVVDGAGAGVAGAEIELAVRRTPGLMRIEIGGPKNLPRALSDSKGGFRIESIDPDSTYNLEVEAEGFAPAEMPIAGLEPYQTKSGVRIALDRGRALTGAVVDEEGLPIAGAAVELGAAGAAGGGHMMRIMEASGSETVFAAMSDDEGLFVVSGLPQGKFDLDAHRRGFARRTLPGVEIGDSDEPIDVGEIVLRPGETLQGVVRDRDGEPIDAVEVNVEQGGGGMVVMLAGPRGGAERKEPDAVTDPAGWFAIGDLDREERYTLRFERAGFVRAGANAVELPRAEPLEVTMEPASDVSGTVLDPDGEPVVGAQVNLRRTQTMEMGGRAMAMMMTTDTSTDEAGRFLFEDQEPGTISLSAVASGFQEARRDNIEVPKGEDLDDVEIPLPPGAILEGRVLSPDGRAAIGAAVGPVGESQGPGGMLRSMSQVGVDGNGYYRLEGLAPGALSVEAVHPDYPRVVRDAEVTEGRNSLDLNFEGGHEVSGRVVDVAGNPVPEAAVRLMPAGRVWGGPEARSGADGGFVMPGVQDGDYRVGADAEGFASFDGNLPVQVAGGPVPGLEVRLGSGGSIVGKVTGLEPERFADVVIEASGAGRAGFGEAEVNYEGHYRIDHLAAGDYHVIGRLSDSGKQATGQVTLEQGASEARVDLRFGGGLTLSGTATQGESPVSGATVFAEGLDVDHTGWGQTDLSGRFALEGLEAGSYEVHVRNFQTGLAYSETVDVATSREITLELPTASVSGRVVDSADRRPLSGVTLTLADPGQAGRAGLPPHTTSTDLDGRFLISSMADGQWRLSASRKGYAAYSIPVTVQFQKHVDDLEVVMDPTEGLTLEARLPGGAAPDAVNLSVLDPSGAALLGGSYTTAESGRVRLSSVPPGSWDLVVSAAGAATSQLRAQAPGPPVAVQLEPATGMRVEVPDLLGSGAIAWVRLQNSQGQPFRSLGWTAQPRSEWRMEGGRIEFSSLPAGAWTVTVAGPDGRTWTGSAVTSVGATAQIRLE